jgi:hypothetical protein
MLENPADAWPAIRILALLFIVNGAPILLSRLLGTYLDKPLDGGFRLPDHRPLFGPSKTIRGLAGALLMGAVAAPVLGLSVKAGLLTGIGAMLGDLLSSFTKRRLGIRSSGMALGLDQIPESLIPLLLLRREWALSGPEILALVTAFLVFELVLSRFLYWLHIRREPY